MGLTQRQDHHQPNTETPMPIINVAFSMSAYVAMGLCLFFDE
jgi:hypothetical protein